MVPQNGRHLFADEAQSPEATSSANLKWWTYGESDPRLIHAMDP